MGLEMRHNNLITGTCRLVYQPLGYSLFILKALGDSRREIRFCYFSKYNEAIKNEWAGSVYIGIEKCLSWTLYFYEEQVQCLYKNKRDRQAGQLWSWLSVLGRVLVNRVSFTFYLTPIVFEF